MPWAPDYASVAELKSYLRIEDAADDVFLQSWVTTVSRNVDDFCGRQFGQTDDLELRRYAPVWDRAGCRWAVEIDDVMDTDDMVVVDGAAAAVTYELEPANAAAKGRPYTRIVPAGGAALFITARWGWSPLSSGPVAAKVGVFLQAARLAARRDAPFGVAGSPTEGSEVRLLAQLDPDFRTSLKPFRRRWWAA